LPRSCGLAGSRFEHPYTFFLPGRLTLAEGLDRSVYPAIPKKLWEYYERILVDRPSHRLVEATQRQGVEKTWRAINEIFVLACQATRLSSDELFELLGFKNNDFDSENFQ
jgi:hypothetical protein